ncbi:MAG TPA: carboxypeptidase-like regulatory domain-containing protein, partial [Terriglobia bacterium]|nr:carboxypeptidase-like regulatory domain-containing protein [Terriglobia bacterium]
FAGFPHPKLIGLEPGEDYEERAVIQLRPASTAQGDASQPFWGSYKFSVTYRARYSNGPNLNAILGAHIWEGEVESNAMELQLRPAADDARASVTGSVINAQMQPLYGILVTLSDQQERPIAQANSDENGKFGFTRLPFGFYWLTVRRGGSSQDATVLRHVTPSPSGPSEDLQIALLPVEVHHPEKLLHKPVLFRVLDSQDKPVAGVALDDTWSTGTVSDEVRGSTNGDGAAMLQLIPGRNFVTLARKGCAKKDERVEVAPGAGIDGFKLVFDCSKK